jgi:RNA polymerase sigma factor (sigma-70 family)
MIVVNWNRKIMTDLDFKRYVQYCRKYANSIFGYRSPEYNDAISEGLVAVVRAIQSYNPNDTSGASLNTYITASIKNSILSYRNHIENTKLAENQFMTSRDQILDEYDIDIVLIEDNSHIKIDSEYILTIVDDFMNSYDNERIKLVFFKIFKEDKNLVQTSEEMNIGVEAVRQYRQRIIQLLRNHFKSLNIGGF